MGIQLILLSLLSLVCLSASQVCSPALLENMSFPGNDVQSFYAADAVHCQHLCTQHPSCRFFTFFQPDSESSHFLCYLKSTTSGRPTSQIPRIGAISGYNCTASHKSPCLPNVYEHVDFPGATFRSVFTYDYKECQRVCTEEPGCQFFTFVTEKEPVRNIRYKCELKFTWDIPTPLQVRKTRGIIAGFSDLLQLTESNKPDCETDPFINLEIIGNDILRMPAFSFEHCETLCNAHPLCTYFSYNRVAVFCYLKSNTGTLSFRGQSSFTSGMPTRFCKASRAWTKVKYEGIDLWGSDLGFVIASDVNHCHRLCTDNPECQFYSYTTDVVSAAARRRCYMKRVITLPSPPRVATRASVISGFTLRNCV